ELGKKLDETGAAWAPWASKAGPAAVVVSESITGVHQVVEGLAFLLQGNFTAAAADGRRALDSFGRAIKPISDAIGGALATALNWLTTIAWPALQDAAGAVASFIIVEV